MDEHSATPHRIVVIGVSCSGKTTLATRLAAQIGCPHIELDALYWGPDWQAASEETFRRAVTEATSGEEWVVDGSYIRFRDIVWARATAVVWLNYCFPRVFTRALRRTFRRVFRREVLFSGNRESFRGAFLSRESILWWVISTYRRHRRRYRQLLESEAYVRLQRYELHHPREANDFQLVPGGSTRRSGVAPGSPPRPCP